MLACIAGTNGLWSFCSCMMVIALAQFYSLEFGMAITKSSFLQSKQRFANSHYFWSEKG